MISVKELLGINGKVYDSLPKNLVEEFNKHRPLGPQKKLCYAPFKSIYFGNNGSAGVCCYNREHSLGQYPQQSIHEMWFGAEADKLRDYISHNDLSLGCLSCKQHMLAGNFDGTKNKQYDWHKLNKNRYPSVMEFELSNVCNLECEMCNGEFSSLIRAKREGLPPLPQKYDEAFVDQLEEFIPHLEEVKFYGGEPFLIDIYYTIWERILQINPNVRIQVQTNATTLNSRLKDLMNKVDFQINVSFDSLKKEVYEKIRKNADYDKVVENIEYFRNYCKERNNYFGISVCAMQQNWQELPEFINFCNERNTPVYFHTVSYPLKYSIRSLPPEEIRNICAYLEKFSFPADNEVQEKNKKHYFDFINQIKSWYYLAEVKPKIKPLTFDEFKKAIIESVESEENLSPTAKQKKVRSITNKMNSLTSKINSQLLNQLIGQILYDEFPIKDIVGYIDKLPEPALLLMAKAASIYNPKTPSE